MNDGMIDDKIYCMCKIITYDHQWLMTKFIEDEWLKLLKMNDEIYPQDLLKMNDSDYP